MTFNMPVVPAVNLNSALWHGGSKSNLQSLLARSCQDKANSVRYGVFPFATDKAKISEKSKRKSLAPVEMVFRSIASGSAHNRLKGRAGQSPFGPTFRLDARIGNDAGGLLQYVPGTQSAP
jgi:hypothetical protein